MSSLRRSASARGSSSERNFCPDATGQRLPGQPAGKEASMGKKDKGGRETKKPKQDKTKK